MRQIVADDLMLFSVKVLELWKRKKYGRLMKLLIEMYS